MSNTRTTRAPKAPEQALLIAAIAGNPADDLPRLVYADWLDEHGDPDRAESIRAQVYLARLPAGDPAAPALAARAAELLGEHGSDWLSELGVKVAEVPFRRGFPEAVTMTAAGFLRHGRRLLEAAPVTAAHLTNLGDRAGRLAESPLLARLSSLELSGRGLFRCADHDATALFRSPHVAGLRRLALSSGAQGNFAALAASDRLPRLRVLKLHFGLEGLEGLERALSGPRFAGLTALDLGYNHIGDGGARVLAAAPALRRLRQLELARSELTDAGALAIAGSETLRGLRHLNVSLNYIGGPGLRALARREGLHTLRAFGNPPTGAG